MKQSFKKKRSKVVTGFFDISIVERVHKFEFQIRSDQMKIQFWDEHNLNRFFFFEREQNQIFQSEFEKKDAKHHLSKHQLNFWFVCCILSIILNWSENITKQPVFANGVDNIKKEN